MPKRLILTFCALAGAAHAGGLQDKGMSGEWAIKVDPGNGSGCLMERSFNSGTVVHVGVVPDKEGAFFAAYNATWTDIVEGDTDTLLFDFGDARFEGEVVGAMYDGVPGGYAFFDNPEFVSEFGKRSSVTLHGAAGGTEMIDLTGSQRAIDTVKECQDAQK